MQQRRLWLLEMLPHPLHIHWCSAKGIWKPKHDFVGRSKMLYCWHQEDEKIKKESSITAYSKPKLLKLFTFGASPLSTRHGCGIRVRFGQPILGTLTKIDEETVLMVSLTNTKTKVKFKKWNTFLYRNFYVTHFPLISWILLKFSI